MRLQKEHLSHLIYRFKCKKSGLLSTPEDGRDFKIENLGWGAYQPKHERVINETLSVKDQNGLSTCQWNATTVQKEPDEEVVCSVRSIVAYAKKNGLLSGEGYSNLRDGQKVLKEWGIAEEGILPNTHQEDWSEYSDININQYSENAKIHKSNSFWSVSSRDDILKLLDEGRRLTMGMVWYTGFNQGGSFSTPWIIDKVVGYSLGGHALCCHPETKILTNEGYKDISDIEIGDEVITRDGFKKVVNINFRDVDEEIFEIDNNLGLNNLKVTKEHPVLSKKSASQTKLKQFFKTNTFYSGLEFIKSSELKKGYFIISLIDDTIKKTNFSNSFVRLLGYYVGDGNLQINYSENGNIKSGKFRFTYHREKKKELADDIISIIKELYPEANYSIYEHKIDKANCLTFYSTQLAKDIALLCGVANNKFIGNEILYMEKEKQMEFLKGWFATDGSGKWLNTSQIFTSKENLALSLLFILQRNRLIYTSQKLKGKIGNIRGKEFIGNGGYNIRFHNKENKSNIKYDGNYIISRIWKITKNKYQGKVYNFEVEDKNEYLADNILVHNCMIGYDLNYHNHKVFVIQNSYSKMWGDNGNFYIDMDYFDKACKQYGAWVNLDIPVDVASIINQYNGKNIKGSKNTVYRIEGGKKRAFPNEVTYYAFNASDPMIVSYALIKDDLLSKISDGEMMDITQSIYWEFLKDLIGDEAKIQKLIEILHTKK